MNRTRIVHLQSLTDEDRSFCDRSCSTLEDQGEQVCTIQERSVIDAETCVQCEAEFEKTLAPDPSDA